MRLFFVAITLSPGCADDVEPAAQTTPTPVDDTPGAPDGDSDDDTEALGSIGGPPPEAPDRTSEYVFDDESPTPALDLAAIERAMSEGLAAVFTIDPMALHQTYEDVRTQGDADCPPYSDDYDYDTWYWTGTCDVDGGASYSGYAYSYFWPDYVDGNYEYDVLTYYSGAARLVDDDGHTLEASGYSYHYQYDAPAEQRSAVYSQIYGEFNWDGPDAGWLSDGVNLDLYISGTHYWSTDPNTYYTALSGSLSGFQSGEGAGITAVDLRDVMLYSGGLGSLCDLEPSGQIAVRDAAGDWYEASFDGPVYWGADAFPPDCDGCATVYVRGEALGSVCPDFEHLANWGERPW